MFRSYRYLRYDVFTDHLFGVNQLACAPDYGITEDPTVAASGPLGCYLVRHRVVPREEAGSMLSLQGVKMGRPSHIHISIGADGSTINNVRVGGEAVPAGEGTRYA
jgi:trans-2,3-dihydro-3-hydroxyanthranilate isomerase